LLIEEISSLHGAAIHGADAAGATGAVSTARRNGIETMVR
jgi:hypothetical protein